MFSSRDSDRTEKWKELVPSSEVLDYTSWRDKVLRYLPHHLLLVISMEKQRAVAYNLLKDHYDCLHWGCKNAAVVAAILVLVQRNDLGNWKWSL